MQDLNIEEFSPLKAEAVGLVERIKSTVISIPGDKTGIELLKENKKSLQTFRTNSVKFLKGKREGFIAGQKFVVSFEKELIGIVSPTEEELDCQIKEIEEAEKRKERLAILPERKEKLASIELKMTDDEILDMDDKVFAQFFIDKKMAYLEEKQAKIDAENKRIEDERLAKESEEKRQADLEKAREEAAANAKKEADEEKKMAVQREKDKAEKAKQKLIDEQARKDQERIDAENKANQEKADMEAKEKADQEKLEKMKKYQKFLTDNGCTKETESEFHIKKDETKVVLYKKVGEFKL